MNLLTIPDIAKRFGVVAGLSDHSMNPNVAVAAVAVGAKVVEKHFILDRKLGGPDVEFSLEPAEFKSMVTAIRETEEALGKVTYELGEKTKKHLFAMRSIFVAKDMKKGDKFTTENIRVVRPGNGLHPRHYEEMLGKVAKKDLKKGTPLERSMVE